MQDIVDVINRYFDEGLTPEEEEILFKKVAEDAELRNVFNQHLQLNMMTVRDASIITPPIETTEGIFKTLGFKIPNNTSRFKTGFTKIGISLAVLIFASLLSVTTISISELIQGNNVSETTITNIPKKANNSMKHLFNYSNNINNLENNNDNTSNIDKYNDNVSENTGSNKVGLTYSQKAQALLKSLYGKKSSDLQDEALSTENIDILTDTDNNTDETNKVFEVKNLLSAALPTTNNDYNINKITANNSNYALTAANSLTSSMEESLSEFNKIYGNSYSKPTYILLLNKAVVQNNKLSNISENNALWNNIDLSLSYNISQSHSIGASIGWKDFSQTFNRTIGKNQYQQQQVPMLFYGALLYAYDFSNIISTKNINPYIQVSAGGTSIGPIMGIDLGTNVNVYRNMGVSAAAGYNLLFYNVENKIYNSDKLGLKFGVFYGF